MDKQLEESCIAFITEHQTQCKGHDAHHSIRVLANARHIMEKE